MQSLITLNHKTYNMEQLLQKLANAKKIMDKAEGIKRGDVRQTQSFNTEIQGFNIPQAKYNIPQEFLSEAQSAMVPLEPRENTKPVGVPTVDAIKNSKLPDQIKKLMIEHPIAQAQQPQMTLSNDLVERATKLMKRNNEPSVEPQSKQQSSQPTAVIDYKIIQKMINEAVENALKKNGFLTESTEKANDNFIFKVGKHIFEGKVTKVKKVV